MQQPVAESKAPATTASAADEADEPKQDEPTVAAAPVEDEKAEAKPATKPVEKAAKKAKPVRRRVVRDYTPRTQFMIALAKQAEQERRGRRR